MPSSLATTQFNALEPLDSDERGLAIDVGQSVDAIVETAVRYLSARP
jgi:gluconokinase